MSSKKTLHANLLWQVSRPAVDAVLLFATTPISSATDVEQRLSHAAAVLGFGDDQPSRFVLGDGVLLPFARRPSSDYEFDQKRLQGWLKKIVNWKALRQRERSALLKAIQPLTERSDARVRSQIVGDKLVRLISYGATSVEQVIGEVLYLIFQHGIAEQGGIAICPGCKAYFVRDREDQKVCSTRCRVREYRRRNEEHDS